MQHSKFRRLTSFVTAVAMTMGLMTAPAMAADAENAADEEQVTIAISNQPKLDVVLTLGQIEKLKGLDLSNFDDDLKAALKARGVDVDRIIRIDKVDTTEKDITSAFQWNTSTYFSTSIGSISLNNTAAGTNIAMKGNPSLPGRNIIFATPLEDNQQTFIYDYSIDFGDSFNAAGMLLRATENNGVIYGYMLSFNNSGSFRTGATGSIWKFRMTKGTNGSALSQVSAEDANGNLTTDGIKLIQNVSIARSGTLKVIANSRAITISGGGMSSDLVIEIPKGSGQSFGFFSDHYSHGCSNIGQFTLTNFRMEETSVKGFVEVLTKDVPDWNENSIRVIVNANQYEEDDFADPDKLAYILSCCKNQDINYVPWGPSTTQSSSQNFIAANDGNGLYVNVESGDDYTTAINKTADYIKSLLPAQDDQGSDVVLMDELVNVVVTPESAKDSTTIDYPDGRWRIVHDPNGYENPNGQWAQSGAYGKLDIESFNKSGKYDIYYEKSLVKTLYVHRKPVAAFSMTLANGSVTTVSNSYDLDEYSRDEGFGPGIAEEEWSWKKSTDTEWTSGKPTSVEEGESYVVALRVKDFQGAWSDVTTKYISGAADPVAPVADFSFSLPQISKYNTTLEFIDNSYDPQNNTITEYTWSVVKDGTTSIIKDAKYSSFTKPTVDFLTYGTGTYAFSLTVKNNYNLTSEKYTRYLTVVDDLDAPEISTDKTETDWDTSATIKIDFSDLDSKLASWGYKFLPTATAPSNMTMNSISGSPSTMSQTVTANKEDFTGEYYLHVWAKDNAGNLAKIVRGPFRVDGNGPDVSISKDNTWTKNDVDLVINVTEDSALESAPTYKVVNHETGETVFEGSLEKITDQKYFVAETLDEEGIYDITVDGKDICGNSTHVESQIRIDKSNPVLDETPYEFIKNSVEIGDADSEEMVHVKDVVTVKINVTDALSGLDKVEYTVNNSKNPITKTGTVVNEEGVTYVYFELNSDVDGNIKPSQTIDVTVYDKAGNSVSTTISGLVMDSQAPTIGVNQIGLPDWVNSYTKGQLTDAGKDTLDVTAKIRDNMSVAGTEWATFHEDDATEDLIAEFNADMEIEEIPAVVDLDDEDEENSDPYSVDDDTVETLSLEHRIVERAVSPLAIETGKVEDDLVKLDVDAYTVDDFYTALIKAWDPTGNVTKESFRLKVDKTLPTIEMTDPGENWRTEEFDLDIEVSDNFSGVKSVRLYTTPGIVPGTPDIDKTYNLSTDMTSEEVDGRTVYSAKYHVSQDGEYKIYLTVVDVAGNDYTVERTIRLDAHSNWTAPSAELNNADGAYEMGEWSTSDVIVTITPSGGTAPVGGFKHYKITAGNQTFYTTENTFTLPNGEYDSFEIVSVSNSGIESPAYTIDDAEILIDTVKPVVDGIYLANGDRLGNDTYFNGAQTLTIKGHDETSGIAYYSYYKDGEWVDLRSNQITIGDTDAEGNPLEFSGDLKFRVTDAAGNVSREFTVENFNIDKTAPVISYDKSENNMLIFTATEDVVKTGSGEVVLKNADGDVIARIPASNNRVKTVGDKIYVDVNGIVAGGSYTVSFEDGMFTDKAGNPGNGVDQDVNYETSAKPILVGVEIKDNSDTEIRPTLDDSISGSRDYQVVTPIDAEWITIEPKYSGDVVGNLTTDVGTIEDGKVKINLDEIENGTIVTITMGEEINHFQIWKSDYEAKADSDIGGSVDDSDVKGSVDVSDDILNGAQDIDITVNIKKDPSDNGAANKEIASGSMDPEKDKLISDPIQITVEKDVDGEKSDVENLQEPITVTIPVPDDMKDRKDYKIIHVIGEDVEVIEPVEKDGKLVFEVSDVDPDSSYFITAGDIKPVTPPINNGGNGGSSGGSGGSGGASTTKKSTLYFKTNGGNEIDPVTVKTGTKIDLSKYTPVREGYTFEGWYGTATFDDEIGTFFISGDTVTVYAKWTRIGADHDASDFLETEDHYAYIIGRSDGNMGPEMNITRGETATIFFRLLKDDVRAEFWSSENPYPDLEKEKWFNNAVSTMTKLGMVNGYNNGDFGGDDAITRAEFATIAVRFFGGEYLGDTDKFGDIDGHWAVNYINQAAQLGLVEGYGDGTFRPDAKITRAEAITIVNRVLGRDKLDNESLTDDIIDWPDVPTSMWCYNAIAEATNSHNYERGEDNMERWTSLKEVRDWAAFERVWSNAFSA